MSYCFSWIYLCFSLCSFVGTVPITVCSLVSLAALYLNNNPDIKCYPTCFNSIADYRAPSQAFAHCPSFQQAAVCGFLAAIDVNSISGGDSWLCNSTGFPVTDPCDGSWIGIGCNGNNEVVSINLVDKGLFGMDGAQRLCFEFSSYTGCMLYDYVGSIPDVLGQLDTLTELNLMLNSLSGMWMLAV